MSELSIFSYQDQPVRTVLIDGEPWFVLADICDVLALPNRSMVASRLADDMKGVSQIDTHGGRQSMTVVSEPGMYEVVIRSDKPQAAAFRRWIVSDVLPAIRKTGSYSVAPELTGPELVAKALIEAHSMLAAKDERIAELEPKAELADTYLDADGGDRLVGQAAKLLCVKEKELRRFLIEEGLVFVRHSKCGTPQYEPYASFSEHFSVREKVVEHTWGNCSHFTLRVKPRGIDLIRKRMAKTGLVLVAGGAA